VGASRRRWWLEVPVLAVAYLAYRQARIWVRAPHRVALSHALDVVHLERRLRIFWEPSVQHAVLGHDRFLRWCDFYYGTIHFVGPVIVLLALYVKRPVDYRRWRNVFGWMLALAVAAFALYPLAPPQMLPPHFHIGHIAALTGRIGRIPASAFASSENPYAAMPSLHVGWSTWCVFAAFPLVGRPPARAALFLYPLATFFVVVVTANHYVLDGIGGWATLAAAYAIQRGWERVRRGATT
jgi:hypothetical protein